MKTKFLIIGAGISGLTFAKYCEDSYIILEKDSEVGGYAKTIKNSNYVWDYAGHFYHFKTEEFKNFFAQETNKKDIVNPIKVTKILYSKKLIDYPFQKNIHQLSKKEFIDCLYDLFLKNEKESYESFLDMLYGKFGNSIVEKFLRPYNEKLYAVDLSNLDVDAMGRFFPYADKEEIIKNMKNGKSNSYNDTFLYPKMGSSVFVDAIYNKLDKSKIILNEKVTSIDFKSKKVTTNTNKTFEYEYLINTSPLNDFLLLFPDNYSKELSYNKVLVLNLGFNKKSKFTKEHWIYVPSKKRNYYRVGFYDNIIGSNKLSMYIEIGYSKDDYVNIEKELSDTLINLKKDGIIDSSYILEDYSSIIMNPAYVHINKIIEKKNEAFFKQISKENIYSIGRYGSWTYCSMEDCMIQAKNLVNTINKI